MAQKPSIPRGTRDFSPLEVAKRRYIMDTIRTQFQNYGFQPIETPSFENSSTLMGKYGEEGDRLIFKILNSGNYLNEKGVREIFKGDFTNRFFTREHFEDFYRENELSTILAEIEGIKDKVSNEDSLKIGKLYSNYLRNSIRSSSFLNVENDFLSAISKSLSATISRLAVNIVWKIKLGGIDGDVHLSDINRFPSQLVSEYLSSKISDVVSEKALRYDLTVPFARYVVQHQNDIVFPFKRYQMQPVWRADKPQKGRFREFYQCDADVVGSDSLWQEVEFVQLYDAVFTALNLEGVTIKMNNRKILSGIAEVIGASDKLIDFTVALDKLDKIGEEGVTKEMLAKGISQEAIDKVAPLFKLSGSFANQLDTLKTLLADSETGMQGITELTFIDKAITELGLVSAALQLDVTLARGLNYYTGAIFEVSAPEGVKMGSIGGGGRYADLTGVFGLKDMSGVGISFGLDRIYLVLEELNLFPDEAIEGVKVLFINFGETESLYAMKAIKSLRDQGVSAILYPDSAKMKKQMTFANRSEIPYLVMAGDSEMESNTFTLKDMVLGEQETVSLEALVTRLKG